MMGDNPYSTAQQVRDICKRLERIGDGVTHLCQVGNLLVEHAEGWNIDPATAQREADKAAWWEAYLHAMQGLLAHHGDTQSDALAASICTAQADAALAALHSRWDEG
jgi:hypothetical protein